VEAPKKTVERARGLRDRMSLPEVLLWRAIRRQQLEGWRFRRQHPIGYYVLDFYCDAAKLAVEVDGYSHQVDNQWVRDERKDAWLAERGIRTLRLRAVAVLKDMDTALRTILAHLPPQSASPTAPPEGEHLKS
jgi:very-short-patch-repair endonuclease